MGRFSMSRLSLGRLSMHRLTKNQPRPGRNGVRFGRPLLRERHIPGLRTAKTTLAAMLAYVVADVLHTSNQPVLASLTALLVVQLTMYETLAHGVSRIISVLAGVLVALGIATFVGLTWWSLGAVVLLSLVVGLLLRLGPHLLEVPISAMLVLAVGGAEVAAAGRVYETLIGAVVGIFVNLAIAPPLYVRPAGEAIADLADRIAGMLAGLSGALHTGWSRPAAEQWLREARGLGAEVAHADRSLQRAEESARLNPRGFLAWEAQPRLSAALTALEHCYISIRGMCRAMFDRAYFVPHEADAYDQTTRDAIADTLDAAAAAIRGVGAVVHLVDRGNRQAADVTAGGTPAEDAARRDVEERLAELHRRRDRLAGLLLVDPHADQGAWQQHGALLAGIDRLRVEVEAAIRPPQSQWRPTLVSERQRKAIRRVKDAAARAAGELYPHWPEGRMEWPASASSRAAGDDRTDRRRDSDA
jgi:hypothetical protein